MKKLFAMLQEVRVLPNAVNSSGSSGYLASWSRRNISSGS